MKKISIKWRILYHVSTNADSHYRRREQELLVETVPLKFSSQIQIISPLPCPTTVVYSSGELAKVAEISGALLRRIAALKNPKKRADKAA